MTRRPAWLVLPSLFLLTVTLPDDAAARPPAAAGKHDDGGQGEHGGGSGDPTIAPLPALGAIKCRKGRANVYPCHNVDLLSFVPLAELSPERWWTKLGDLEYTLRVTDTATGVTHDYVDHTEPVCTSPDPLY